MKDLVEMLYDIDEYGEQLTFENKKFLDDMMRKAAGPPPISFTERQTKYIRSLWYEKVPEEWR